MKLYIVGGEQRELLGARDRLNGDWYEYGRGTVIELETQSRSVRAIFETTDDRYTRQVTFKCASRDAGTLYVPTMTSLKRYSLSSFELLDEISLPLFNDVHHVVPDPDGNLLVANSGLDNCVKVSVSGDVLEIWNALGEDPWGRFDPAIDYRSLSTKPHRSHPNFIFMLEDELWTTRFHQRDAISLTDPRRHINIAGERVHDGVLKFGWLYFSTVDSHVVVVDPKKLCVVERYDLRSLDEREEELGWMRGILPVTSDLVWVAFSKIRATRFRAHLQFIVNGFARTLPTRIALYDLSRQALLEEIPLEQCGLNAIFSILPAEVHE